MSCECMSSHSRAGGLKGYLPLPIFLVRLRNHEEGNETDTLTGCGANRKGHRSLTIWQTCEV